MAIGVARQSTTIMPPPRRLTNTGPLSEAMNGQIGALSGRRAGSWHGRPLGVAQLARSRVAAGSWANVLAG
jgi:hypothetical protein